MAWGNVSENKIITSKPAVDPMLCAPDAVAHSFFRAVEKNRNWGHYELAYAAPLTPRLWRPASGSIDDHGLTIMPVQRKAIYLAEMPWLREWGQ